MNEVRYMISEASKKLEVEAHVLRYWEDELELTIKRNEMGHRYYTKEDMHLFEGIKELKAQGFQLKAIRKVLPEIKKAGGRSLKHLYRLRDELNGDMDGIPLKEIAVTKEGNEVVAPVEETRPEPGQARGSKMEQFQMIMGNLIRQAIAENNQHLSKDISGQVSDSVLKEMDYIMRLDDEREEERYRKLDETIRSLQKGRQEVAAAEEEEKPKKKRGLFGRKK